MLKWLFGLGLVLLIAIGFGGYYVYRNLDALVEEAIEEIGSEAVGVAVRVDRVELDLEAGRASIFGLSVANPKGFEGAMAFTLGEMTIDIDLDSIRDRRPLVLDEIRIESPVVFYEIDSVGKSNLEVLGENATSGSQSASGGEGAGESQPAQRVSVRKIRFAGGRVEADTRKIGGNEMQATLATATLSNVGGSRGATGSEIGKIVVEELARQTALAIGKEQLDKLLKDQIGDDGAKAVKGLLNIFGR